ncbi:hypothetical protein [Pseudomonas phage Teru]|nr:hypothetical protein [Pseudomonas phage BUCT640]WNV48515.1 hypothetical protein [Pseudomonas phage Teru]
MYPLEGIKVKGKPKQRTAVYKGGRKTAKTDIHRNNRKSVFGSPRLGRNPLDILLNS